MYISRVLPGFLSLILAAKKNAGREEMNSPVPGVSKPDGGDAGF